MCVCVCVCGGGGGGGGSGEMCKECVRDGNGSNMVREGMEGGREVKC